MSSLQKTLADRPILEVMEEAAREAADKVRDRNQRMGWPLITGEYLRQQEESKDCPSEP
jgi:hypothetical protein